MKTLISSPARLAYPHLFKKRPGMQNDDGSTSEPKFEATFILPHNHPSLPEIRRVIAEVAHAAWGTSPAAISLQNAAAAQGRNIPAVEALMETFDDDQKGLRDGNKKPDSEGFIGNLFIAARTKARPGVFGLDGKTPLAEEDGVIYSGCMACGEIDVWALNKPGVKKRIVIDLLGVQFAGDAEPFTAGAPPTTAGTFGDLSAAPDQGAAFDPLA